MRKILMILVGMAVISSIVLNSYNAHAVFQPGVGNEQAVPINERAPQGSSPNANDMTSRKESHENTAEEQAADYTYDPNYGIIEEADLSQHAANAKKYEERKFWDGIRKTVIAASISVLLLGGVLLYRYKYPRQKKRTQKK